MTDPWWGSDDPRTPEQIQEAAQRQRDKQRAYAEKQASEQSRYQVTTSAQAHDDWMDELNTPVEGAIRTGWPGIDNNIGREIGLGEVIIIAARTGVGKSWIVQHMTERKLRNDASAYAVFMTMEMPEYDMARRVATHILGVPPGEADRLARDAQIPTVGTVWVEERAQWLNRLVYYPRPNTKVSEIPKVIEAAAAAGQPPTILVVDYMGLLGGERGMGTYDRASANARELKEIAKASNVTVLAAVQLSRSGGRDGNYEPGLDALRDSGVIEEASDRVLMFWRGASEEGGPVRVRCKVAKNRHGPIGDSISLEFDSALRLRQVADDSYALE